MARITHDREDLLREATALTPRVVLAMDIEGERCEVFAGFRGESLSIYFGPSPVYHFNATGELRRAFLDDGLIKAESGQLICLVRERSAPQVVLASTPLSAEESGKFLDQMSNRLSDLRCHLSRREFEIIGQVPDDSDAVSRLTQWLTDWPGPRIADVANVR
jgi:hypothetical protein